MKLFRILGPLIVIVGIAVAYFVFGIGQETQPLDYGSSPAPAVDFRK